MKFRMIEVSTIAIMILTLFFVLFCFPKVALADEGGEHEHGSGISLFSFVKPLGICALTLILVTFGTGLFRRRLKRRFLRIHKILAWLTVGVALCHGILVLALF